MLKYTKFLTTMSRNTAVKWPNSGAFQSIYKPHLGNVSASCFQSPYFCKAEKQRFFPKKISIFLLEAFSSTQSTFSNLEKKFLILK